MRGLLRRRHRRRRQRPGSCVRVVSSDGGSWLSPWVVFRLVPGPTIQGGSRPCDGLRRRRAFSRYAARPQQRPHCPQRAPGGVAVLPGRGAAVVPEQRQGVRELQEALRSLEKRAKTAQRADGHPYSRREAAKQANAAPFHAGGLDARRVGEWLADNGRVPRDPDKVWALVQVWAKWSGDRSQQQTYWNALVEAAQPTSRRRLTLDDHVEAPNGEKVLSGSPWVSPPWMAPPSRSDLVERPELVEELLMALSGAKSADPMAVVAVCGAGGFGKTTLVKQVCQRPEIAEAFPGGLLWTELGQDRQGAY